MQRCKANATGRDYRVNIVAPAISYVFWQNEANDGTANDWPPFGDADVTSPWEALAIAPRTSSIRRSTAYRRHAAFSAAVSTIRTTSAMMRLSS